MHPWLVRALIPPAQVGSYLLYQAAFPIYVGRSDTDLRRRLLRHARSGTGDYFAFNVHSSSSEAYRAECGLFHAVGGPLANRIHPDAPDHLDIECSFCSTSLYDVLDNRLVAQPVAPIPAESEISPPQLARERSHA